MTAYPEVTLPTPWPLPQEERDKRDQVRVNTLGDPGGELRPPSEGGMSTREIAELTGKEHKNVLRDVRNLIEQGAMTTDRKSVV